MALAANERQESRVHRIAPLPSLIHCSHVPRLLKRGARIPFLFFGSNEQAKSRQKQAIGMKKAAPKAQHADAKPYQPTPADAQALDAYMAARKKAAPRLKVVPGAKGAVT